MAFGVELRGAEPRKQPLACSAGSMASTMPSGATAAVRSKGLRRALQRTKPVPAFVVGGDDARKMADEFGGFVAADLMNLPKLHAIARVGPRDASFNLETHFIPPPDRSAEEAYADLRERTRRRYATPKAEIRKELEALREFLPKKKAIDPFAELAAKQKRERQERDEPSETTASGNEPAPNEGPAETTESVPLPRPAPVEPTVPRRPSRPPPPVAPVAEPSALEPDTDAAGETPELKTGKAESIKNALVQTAGSWGFGHKTEFEILGRTARVDIVLTLGERSLACEISATTTPEQEAAHLVNCLAAGFTEIVCVCDATVRRRKIEELVRRKVLAGQESFFRYLTVRQLQTLVSDIGQAAQKSEAPDLSGKAPPVSIVITREEQDEVALRQLAEIAERRAKAKAARGG